MNYHFHTAILTGFLLVSCGCSSVSNRFQSLVSRAPDRNDPLAQVIEQESSKTYKTAKKELNRSEETLLKFARWREDMGDHAEAKSQYADILADNADCVEARLGIARVEFTTGRVAEAIEILQATARKYPERADTWAELGRIQVTRQEWGAAISSLTKAYELDSANQTIRYELGIALARADRLEEAREHLAFAVGESAALYNIGYVLHEAGRNEQSGHWFRRALNAHPDQRTERAASQMLAQLSGASEAAPAARQPGRVDVALTNYESWRETPGKELQEIQRQQPTGTVRVQTVSSQQTYAGVAPPNNTAISTSNSPFAASATPQWQGPSGVSQAAPVSGAQHHASQPQQWHGPGQ